VLAETKISKKKHQNRSGPNVARKKTKKNKKPRRGRGSKQHIALKNRNAADEEFLKGKATG